MRGLTKRILATVLVVVMLCVQMTTAFGSDSLTGSGWWTDCQKSTAQSLADGGSVVFSVAITSDSLEDGVYAAFCVEATDGTSYFTATSDGDCWGAGTDTDSTSGGVVVGGTYTVTVARSGNDFTADIVDDNTGSSILSDPMYLEGTSDYGTTTCYIMTQVGDLTVDVLGVFPIEDSLTGSGWWTSCQTSTGITLPDGYTATFTVEITSDSLADGVYAAFCVEAKDGTNYFTATSDGDCWGEGTDTDSDSSGAVVGGTYTVTVARSGNNFTADIVDNETGKSILDNAMYLAGTTDFGTTTCYIMTQVGNLTVNACGIAVTTSSGTTSSYDTGSSNHVSVHDPSIVKGYVEESVTSLDMDTEIVGVADDTHTKGIYFIFGSHLAFAYSWDLCTWTTFNNNITTDYETLFAKEAEWSALGSSSYDLSGNMWAPDVIWNEAMGKWCMYMSINGDNWYSTICMLTADSLYGEWTYVGMVIQSGNYNYAKTGATFDYYTATGETESDNNLSRYTANRNGNLTYEDNCIDPCVIYDEEGNLWMTYGSWFGGIWMIKLDENTGLRDYTYTYEYVENVTDPYQGYKLAGGFHSSGEASYIEYYGGYYYLFVTYGGLTAAGGYNMRVYRSTSITGPYTDESGDAASYTAYLSNISSTVGMRLMSYYKWSYQTYAQVAQGHNSVYYDKDTDQIYLVYHTRTNDGTEGHSIRVHQLFQNEDGWLVTAPFEYQHETTTNKDITSTHYEADDVAGSYEVLLQAQSVDYTNLAYVEPVYIILNADGSISGDLSGTWTITDENCYITLVTSTDTYRGVLLTQTVEDGDTQTITFTGVGVNTETAIWGYQYDALEQDYEALTLPAQTVNGTSLDLSETGTYGAYISWASSDESLIATDGTVVTVPEENTDVTLTATLSDDDGNTSVKTFTVTVIGTNSTDEEGNITVWSMADTYNLTDAVQGTYSFPNYFNSTVGTNGLTLYSGVSIEFTVELTGTYDCLSTILSFNTGSNSGNLLYFDGGSYLGYNATGGYFDANINNYDTGVDYIGSDAATIKIVILPDTYEVYVNGKLAYDMASVNSGETYGDNTNMGTIYNVLTFLSSTATEFDLGWGDWWDDRGAFQGTISNITLTALADDVDTCGYAYYADYSAGGGSLSDWISTNDSSALVLTNDGDSYGNYVCFQANTGTNSRGAYTTALSAAGVSKDYTVEVDIKLTNGYDQTSEFAITTSGYTWTDKSVNNGIDSGYILKLQATAAGATTYYVNGGTDTVTIPSNTWVHITATVDENGETVDVVISYDGATDQEISASVNKSSELAGLYVRRGRYNGTFSVDNIKVYQTPSIEFLGGSLRIDSDDYGTTSLRFGYTIDLGSVDISSIDLEDEHATEWSWKWSVDGASNSGTVEGVSWINNEDGTITTNLVITGIPSDYYTYDLCSILTVTYCLGGKTITITDEAIRSVEYVATAISEDTSASDDAKAYAAGILDAISSDGN